MTRTRSARRGRNLASWVLIVVTIVYALVLAAHHWLPNVAGATTALESFLPWTGAVVVVFALAALVLRSGSAALALLLPIGVWSVMFGPTLLRDHRSAVPAGGHAITVVTENINSANPNPLATVRRLQARHADLVAIEGMTSRERTSVAVALGGSYHYSTVVGTNGLWSSYRLGPVHPVALGHGLGDRAFETTATTPTGPVDVYVAHLASVRLGQYRDRDATLAILRAAVTADQAAQVIVAGDFNTATTDREMSRLTDTLTDSQEAAGAGFGFTYPSRFPLTRPDHILTRGMRPSSSIVLPANGSDHRGIEAVMTPEPLND